MQSIYWRFGSNYVLSCLCLMFLFIAFLISHAFLFWRTVPDKNSVLACIFCRAVWDLITSFPSSPSTLTAAASGIDRYGIWNSHLGTGRWTPLLQAQGMLLQQEIIHVWVASSKLVGCWLSLLVERTTKPFLGINYSPLQNDLRHMRILLASTP